MSTGVDSEDIQATLTLIRMMNTRKARARRTFRKIRFEIGFRIGFRIEFRIEFRLEDKISAQAFATFFINFTARPGSLPNLLGRPPLSTHGL